MRWKNFEAVMHYFVRRLLKVDFHHLFPFRPVFVHPAVVMIFVALLVLHAEKYLVMLAAVCRYYAVEAVQALLAYAFFDLPTLASQLIS